MQDDVIDFSHIPLALYIRAHRNIIYQLTFGALALILSFIITSALLSAILKAFAAIALVIGIANAAASFFEWRRLKLINFAAIGKIAETAPIGDTRLYKVEFTDCEGIKRDCAVLAQSWEKKTFAPGDKLKILYDPRRPQELINYSAYEALKGWSKKPE